MKSFFGFLLALLVSATFAAQAQTAPAAPKADHAPMAAPAPKMDKPARMAKAKPAATVMPGGPGPMKKDGTPDMRYKANRTAKGRM